MTILATKQKVSGTPLDGFQISCAGEACGHCSAFVPSQKHLPPEVIEKKFQQRGWEVNSSGKDYCPDCIARRRAPKKRKTGVAGAAEKTIQIETQLASASNLRKIIANKGLFPSDCIELEHRQTKFKITFRGIPEIHIGRITDIETDVMTRFNAALISSSLRFDLQHSVDKATHTMEVVINWYLTIEVSQKLANYPLTAIPHHNIAAE